MAEAAGKYLQDFSTAHAADLNKVVATLTSPPPDSAAASPGDGNEAPDNGRQPRPMRPVTRTWPLKPPSLAGQSRCRRPISSGSAGDHVGAALAGGGSQQTEAAVQAALKWLAEHQSEDGRWEARRNEAGRETTPDGRSRPNAGADADTGMTGLALLAMLGGGQYAPPRRLSRKMSAAA